MFELQLEALGTKWWINYHSDSNVDEELRSIIADFEQKYSRFKTTSLLSQLNSQKFLDSAPLEMIEMLELAIEAYRHTNGKFNISVGGYLSNNGYGQSVNPKAKIGQKIPEQITIDQQTIALKSEISLDFGGFGKGWLIDKMAFYFDSIGVLEYFINGGGDMRIKSTRPQTVYVENPFLEGSAVAELTIKDGSVAASAPNRRRWHGADGEQLHHLIDPLQSTPANHYASVHVYTNSQTKLGKHSRWTTALADIYAKYCYLLPDTNDILQLAKKSCFNVMAIRNDGSYVASKNYPADFYK